MKKVLICAVLLLCLASLHARPVDVTTARKAAERFASCTFRNYDKSAEYQLVYTAMAERGEACFYVFNVDESGFVIISADDRFRPVVGYSDEGTFATENPSPELMYYLDRIVEARTSPKAVVSENAALEWKTLMEEGKTISRNGGKAASYLCTTLWNQDSPYNLYAPEAPSGPGGRCYAGCVATAMSQVMKYWDHPTTGTGSHSYYSSYGHLSANFGATTYRWDRMPYRLANSEQDEIEAVALLMYHCGISVNMGYGPSGSGAYSDDVPPAIRLYFSYTDQAKNRSRNNYSLTGWQNLLKEQFDRSWPVYYSGYSDSGGHAFVCDGYDDNDLFHFNWGWGGSSDGWFVIDEIDYAGWAAAVVNFVPHDVYLYSPEAPLNLTVESLGDNDFSATISWTNPSYTVTGSAITSIQQMVVTRNGEIIQTFENPATGASMSFTDHYLPSTVNYAVYAVSHDVKGIEAKEENVVLGPSCGWSIDMTSSSSDGWNTGCITVTDGKNVQTATLSSTSSSQTKWFEMPMGTVSFVWSKPAEGIDEISFAIKNTDGDIVTSYEGSPNDLGNGLILRVTNGCQDEENSHVPYQLTADMRDEGVLLQWQIDDASLGNYFIYRDGLLYDRCEDTSYTDLFWSDQYHYYQVSSYDGVVESERSNRCDVNIESDCLIPTNLRCEVIAANKVKLLWDAPQAEGLSGYVLYRRHRGEEFKHFKNLTSAQYTVNLTSYEKDIYEFAVRAYYAGSHCESSFAPTQELPYLHFVEINNSFLPTDLTYDLTEDGVQLRWNNALTADSYEVYRNGVLLAEQVAENGYLDTSATMGEAYCYFVKGKTALMVSNPSNTVCVDWNNAGLSEYVSDMVSVYPIPASDVITVTAEGMQHITVFDLMGQAILSREAVNDTETLNVKQLKKGTYFVRVVTQKGSATVKVVK